MVRVDYRVRNLRGDFRPFNLFQFFDDGIRKRLPKNIAKELHTSLINNIDENRFNFELSNSWRKYKHRIGADKRPFIMFNHYKNAISIITDNGHLSVGFTKSTIHPRARMRVSQLALVLEYGDSGKGIPARPLWRRTLKEFVKDKKLREIAKVTISK